MIQKQNGLKLFLAMCGVAALFGYKQVGAMQSGTSTVQTSCGQISSGQLAFSKWKDYCDILTYVHSNPDKSLAFAEDVKDAFDALPAKAQQCVKEILPCYLIPLPPTLGIEMSNVFSKDVELVDNLNQSLHKLNVNQSCMYQSLNDNLQIICNGMEDKDVEDKVNEFKKELKEFDVLLKQANPQIEDAKLLTNRLDKVTKNINNAMQSGNYQPIKSFITRSCDRALGLQKLSDWCQKQWDDSQTLGSFCQGPKTMEPSKQRPDVNSSQLPNSTNPTSSSSAQKKVPSTAPKPDTTPDLDGDNNDSITPRKSVSAGKQQPDNGSNGSGSGNTNSSDQDNGNNQPPKPPATITPLTTDPHATPSAHNSKNSDNKKIN